MTLRYLWIITLITILSGCVSYATSPVQTNTVPTIPIMTTITPRATLELNPAVPAVELTEPEIPTCTYQENDAKPVESLNFNGVMLFQQPDHRGLFALTGGSFEETHPIVDPSNELATYGFSPDGKTFAYATVQRNDIQGKWLATPSLILMSDLGQQIGQKVDIQELSDELLDCCADQPLKGFWSGYWINNELLYLEIQASDNQGGMFRFLPEILDPYKWDWQKERFGSLPNLTEVNSSYFKSHEIGLSPDLNHVLYPLEFGGIALRDITKDIEIWSDKGFSNPFGEFIRWTFDGQFVAVANFATDSQRLLLISANGKSKEIITSSDLRDELVITDINWSPNGQYLAFINSYDTITTLYMYGRLAEKYLYYCPMNDISGWPKSTWSPDNNWIAVSSPENGSPIRLLSLQTGEQFKLLDNGFAVGWSDKFPVAWP